MQGEPSDQPAPLEVSPLTIDNDDEEVLRARERELADIDMHNNVETQNLLAYSSINLEFFFGSGANMRPIVVESFDRVDMNVLMNCDTLEMTDRIMQAALWYAGFFLF